eukprot:6638913-Prymnesium_polylepis.1
MGSSRGVITWTWGQMGSDGGRWGQMGSDGSSRGVVTWGHMRSHVGQQAVQVTGAPALERQLQLVAAAVEQKVDSL